MKIYVDVLLFINLVSSYAMLSLTAWFLRCRPRLPRLLSAAALGAVLAAAGFCSGKYAAAAKLLSAVLVPAAAFGLRGSIKPILIFSLLSALAAGLFALLSGSSQTIVMRGGIMYFDLSAGHFLAVSAAVYAVILLSSGLMRRRERARRRRVEVSLNGKTICLTALADSGSVLKEPLTGKDVIIAEWEAARTLFGCAEYAEWERGIEEYRLWLIPYRSLGNPTGVIYAFLADEVIVSDEKRRLGRLFVGITNERLSRSGEYNALMGALI